MKCKHVVRVVYNDGEPTEVRWCSRCGAIYHKVRRKHGGWSKRPQWQQLRGDYSWRKLST